MRGLVIGSKRSVPLSRRAGRAVTTEGRVRGLVIGSKRPSSGCEY